MANNAEVFRDLLAASRKYAPKTVVVPKRTMWLHKTIAKILKVFGNKQYMDSYWTTIGFKIAQPGVDEVDENGWGAIPHEGNHAIQAKKLTRPLFGSFFLLGTPAYMVPALVASWPFFVWLPWWSGLLFVLGCAVVSSPVPFGMFRAHWELEAYGLSVAQRYWLGHSVDDAYFERRARQFTTSAYFWMCPFKKYVLKKLKQSLEDAKSGKIFKHKKYGTYYQDVYNVLKKHSLVRNTVKD